MSRLRTFLLLGLPYTFLVWHYRFLTDDCFISFRYARNLADGHGLRFNLGETTPVEGYSNFLWVLACALLEKLRLDMTVWPLLLSAACGYVLLWLVHDRLRSRLGVPPAPAALGALTLAAFPPFAVWATGGLATMPFALCVFLTFDRLFLRERPDVAGGAIAAIALSLVRFEGVAWVAVIFVLAAVLRRDHRRALIPAAAVFLAVYAAYSFWRVGYHGHFLPNTAMVKTGGDARAEGLLRGARYVLVHAVTFLTPFLLIPASVVALRRPDRRTALAVIAMAWAFPAYAVVVTGDFMAMGRFLVPGFAFQAVLFAWMLQAMGRRTVQWTAAVVLVALPLPGGWNVHAFPLEIREAIRFRRAMPFFLSEAEYWEFMKENTDLWTDKGIALRRYVDRNPFPTDDPVCVTSPLGCVGYYSDLTLLDRPGLITPAVVERGQFRRPGESIPGHDRIVPFGFFVALEPEVLRSNLVYDADPATLLFQCNRFASLLRAQKDAPDAPDRYVMDFDDVSPPGGEETWTLIAWRKINGDPDAAWGGYRARIDSLQAVARSQPRKFAPGDKALGRGDADF
jgi:hypothetical protein